MFQPYGHRAKTMGLHTTKFLRVVAFTSACGLVVASAGFGSVFAYKVGIEHSILLAGLSILMALALEGIKPLAISAAFSSFASITTIPRGLCLALLGLVAVAYSLTSELSLVSMSRGDLAAERSSVADRQEELRQLAPSRPSAEVQAAISGLKLDRLYSRSKDCTEPQGDQSRALCQQLATLEAEKARAERRSQLEGQTKGHVVQGADPGSTALATYLLALGLVVAPEVIAQWLNLVPVLALEIGSALAAILVQAVGGSPPVVQAEKPGEPKARKPKAKTSVEAQLVDHLKQNTGAKVTERGLAALLGSVSRSTVRRSIHSLAAAGVIALEASKQGTIIRLLT